jgi:hypothetical protein
LSNVGSSQFDPSIRSIVEFDQYAIVQHDDSL